MAVTGNLYQTAMLKAFSGVLNWSSDSIKAALLGAGYTPSLSTHANWSDVSAAEVTGTGYTAGGQVLTSKTLTTTAANSWATAAAVSTSYAAAAVVRPATGNGFLYQCVTAGTSSATAPTWPTVVGQDVTDGSVTWVCKGESITQLSSAAPSWTSSTITASFLIIYDAQSGVSTTEPLLALCNLGGSNSSSNGPFTLTPAALGWVTLFPA